MRPATSYVQARAGILLVNKQVRLADHDEGDCRAACCVEWSIQESTELLFRRSSAVGSRVDGTPIRISTWVRRRKSSVPADGDEGSDGGRPGSRVPVSRGERHVKRKINVDIFNMLSGKSTAMV